MGEEEDKENLEIKKLLKIIQKYLRDMNKDKKN